MATRRPLVLVSGLTSELPDGDSVVGVGAGTVTAGSGLDGGGDVSNDIRLDVQLAPNPSGIIYVGTGDTSTIGLDGAAQASGNAGIAAGVTALASGNAALDVATQALASGNAGLASGNAALSLATTALASGNEALAVGASALSAANNAQNIATTALLSGNAALGLATTALASGNAGLSVGTTALASGNAALAAIAAADGGYTYSVISGAKTLANRERTTVLVPLEVSLPLSPSQGFEVAVSAPANVSNVTVSGNGQNIMESSSNLIIDKDNVSVTLVYINPSLGWRIY
jgi:hypothetical protein